MPRNIVITGATSGLGKYVAETLLGGDDHVILIGRNRELLAGIARNHENSSFYVADFSSQSDVKSVAVQIARDFPRIDIVLCNAGILGREKPHITADGVEETFMINYLSHYILLCELFSVKTVPRVIITGSQAARWYTINFDDLMCLDSYKPLHAYGNSKACLQMLGCWIFTLVPETSVYIIDPGTFRSGIARSRAGWFQAIYNFAKWGMRSPATAAKDIMAILDGREFPGGKIIRRGKVKDLSFSTEEFGKLIEKSTALSGCDISRII
ncbi:SDR family NAD(P)-dependent oxidoreductase [Fulvivirga sedimenti]|uniref:SDR family NAD(P)-dependent oxidoreductase n=1 Tax=Fulvivirga sedimenti TaxID=2879465 RepID=A0A9X1HWN6_9BACT|nr:SDR family NAD(P)-dependent oxidoreductase [Fulvivirga sedimenti]MCA6079206.1 SDR family NAD(P)-dependent oxidoreductase [Fulvivirga sedimenti]